MIEIAQELLVKLNHLTLAGRNEDGDLEWIGDDMDWKRVDAELEMLNNLR